MKNDEFVLNDKRTINAVIRKLIKDNELPAGSVSCSKFGYIDYENNGYEQECKVFSNVIYKNVEYKLVFFPGCFCPYYVGKKLD